MRHIIRPFAHHLKWPIRLVAFTVHLMHHLAAFFAWAWMLVHMAGTLAQAGLQAGKLWETQVLSDIWRDGVSYFTTAGGLEWQRRWRLRWCRRSWWRFAMRGLRMSSSVPGSTITIAHSIRPASLRDRGGLYDSFTASRRWPRWLSGKLI